MKRKKFDPTGAVVEAEAHVGQTPGVVGKIEQPITDPLELPSRVMRMQEPAPTPPPPPVRDRLVLALMELHVRLAKTIRTVLLIPGPEYFRSLDTQNRMMAEQHRGFANLVKDVRLRLNHHERTIPLIGRSRAQFDAQQTIRAKRIEVAAEAAQATGLAGLPEHPAPAEAVDHDGDDEGGQA